MSSFSIKLEDIKKVDFIVTTGMSAKQVYEKYKPNYIINGALYDVNTKTNIVFAKDNGQASGYLFTQEGICFDENKVYWGTQKSATNDFVAGSPILIKDGKKSIEWGNKVSTYVNGTHLRSVVGFNDTHLFLMCTDNEMSLDSTAQSCLSLGMKYAINLDGGGSCHLQKDSTIVKNSARYNCSWILIYLKDKQEGDKMSTVTVKCGDKQQEGFIKDGVTYAPVRFLAESLGATVSWDSSTKTTTIIPKK